MRFQDRAVIVTGGSSGIGLACARRFVAEGARVLTADIRQPSPEVEASFRDLPGEWSWIETDLGDALSPGRVLQRALSLWRRVDVLVNNAADMDHQLGALLDTSVEQWNRQFDVAVRGSFLMTRCCLPEMISRRGGAVINMGSIGGINPFSNGAAYCAAKAAILQLTRSVAVDYGLHGIRCNAVCPGATDTPSFLPVKGIPYELADREARIALGRIGQADEVAAAVTFLASDEASYITGAILVVDGGWCVSSWNPRLGPRGLPVPPSK